ncbi:dipeptide ABC transporter ATP-binding protein [Paraburkholderia silvatlantica]|uniref:Peptide/nickel transport system ATP-binding protein n=1 Tax=Paraburkholderia silvatlantica TaxID=321895 RepID=A0ABR6FT58_9BURK|nr:ABC transporter ATP-binding protein [Paraburkholderia silvatlantica]MBB2930624.1 peptide/nickel transport system ATP-binding protein [Paraburkholderia silvatlantica]
MLAPHHDEAATDAAPDAEAAEPVLALDGVTLTATFGAQPVAALRGLRLSIGRGKVLGVVGESGAGKSMLGRLISGLLPAGFDVTSGSMRFGGRDLLAMPAPARRALLGRQIAFVPQEPLTALDPLWTIGRAFDEHLAHIGVPASERASTALRALESVQLPVPEQMLGRYPHQLSGGQCQRVLIAMAFASNPALLIADEPTTALDVLTQTRVMTMLAAQQRQHGSAVLLITHDLRLAAHVCDEIAVMYAGDLVEYGPARDVLDAPRHPYTRALKYATPDLLGPRRRLPVLPHQMPGLSALAGIAGCRFAPRCPVGDRACAASHAERVAPNGHRVACVEACEHAGAADDGAPVPSLPAVVGDGRPVAELREASLVYTSTDGLLGRRKTSFTAVKPLSLRIMPGEFVGIVGESGSGKTSVARLLMGIEPPTDGRVLIGGEDLTHGGEARVRRAREQVQIIFQDPQSALNPRRTVERLLTQALEAAGLPATDAAERLARAQALQRDVGLPADTLQRFPTQLSGGQKQRVNIGRALCAAPQLIVADEIVSGLDVSVQAQILNLLLALRRERQIAVLLISHDLAVVRYLCSRVLVMRRGEVVEEGATGDVFAAPRHPYTKALIEAVPGEAGVPWPPAPLEAAA